MMRTIHLHGSLGERFGRTFRLDVDSAAEAIRALTVNLGPGFRRTVTAGAWHIVAGEEFETGVDYGTEKMLPFGLGRSDLHLAPAISGSKGGGIFSVILGVAVMALAFTLAPPIVSAIGPTQGMGTAVIGSITYGNLAAFGGVMALSGLSQMLTPTPTVGSYSARESAEERPSFLFTTPKNTTEEGGPVPVVYGEHLIGQVLISSGIIVETVE